MAGAVGSCCYCDCRVFAAGSAEVRRDMYCAATKDHVVPVSRGGMHMRTVLACRGCNNVRGNVHYSIFAFFMAEVGKDIPILKDRRKRWSEFMDLIQQVGFLTAKKDADRRKITYHSPPKSIGEIVRRLAA